MHVNAVLAYREHVLPYIPPTARVLELGPDRHPSTFQQKTPAGEWVTADLASEAGRWSNDGSSAELLMPSEYEIPVPDEAFDVLLSSQVVEHVREIWTWMDEVARVVRPGGVVATISPISWPHHESPIDCWRMYPEAMQAVSKRSGLEVVHSWWGTLEPSPSRRTFPGIGARSETERKRFGVLRRLVGWPTPVAYDLVTVASKPAT